MNINKYFFFMLVITGLSGAVRAETISKEAYETTKSEADVTFETEKRKCQAFSGNAQDICLAEAKGAHSVAHANAEANYKGTEHARLKAAKSKVDADYQIAHERCDNLSGNKKDICQQEAKSEKTKGYEAAKLASKNAEATTEFMKTKKEAKEQAGQAIRDADYEVAIEKCDRFSGKTKEQCVQDAKNKFGK
jgi:hypothetical protein